MSIYTRIPGFTARPKVEGEEDPILFLKNTVYPGKNLQNIEIIIFAGRWKINKIISCFVLIILWSPGSVRGHCWGWLGSQLLVLVERMLMRATWPFVYLSKWKVFACTFFFVIWVKYFIKCLLHVAVQEDFY